MKLKTNKLLTLTLATSLVAITAGCGGSKAAKTNTDGDGTGTPPPVVDTVAYSDWSGSVTTADDVTSNAFLAGTAAVEAVGSGTATAANLTGLPNGENATILTLASQVTPDDFTPTGTTKAINAVNLGGDATNAVGFATSGATTEARFVAGVIAGTDLGAPLTATTAAGTWAGLFQAVGADGTYATDAKAFELTVTFGSTDGNTITALVAANDNADSYSTNGDTSYYISGTYNDDGVITGSVLYRDFATGNTLESDALTAAGTALGLATADDADSPATDGLGVLSGLIGANGAVGAFYSNAEGATAGFAGGFVASKAANIGGDDPDVVYADWAAGATQAADTTGDNAFLASNAAGDALIGTPDSGVTVQTLNLRSQVTAPVILVEGVDGDAEARAGVDARTAVTLGGQAADSVAFFTNPGATPATTARYFAGLHSTTDLGDPIAAAGDIVTTAGAWAGLFQAIGADGTYATAARPITLTVTFGATDGNTITAIVAANDNVNEYATAGDTSYYIRGTYDANGVIAGNVLYRGFASATANTAPLVLTAAGTALGLALADGAASPATDGLGVLSGLIGQDGVVGAFYSNANGAAGYAGGFVASRLANPGGDVTTAATPFDPAEYADLTITAPANLTTANAFLPSGGTDVLTFTQPTPNVTPTVLSLPTGTAGGVSFFTTGASGSERYFAGIHNDTNLGLPFPLTTATAGTWNGMFAAVGDSAHATAAKTVTGLLAVTFGASPTIQGSVPAGTATTIVVGTTPTYHINATYDANGVISGTILYEATASASGLTTAGTYADTAGFGRVIGLIGASGAVGAFHSDNAVDGLGAAGYAGGFYATP